MENPPANERDPAYGWFMVFIVFVLSTLSFGALGAVSVFLKPLSAEFGWARGETSLGYTAIALSAALFGVFWGAVADRFGSRWFGVGAALAMTVSMALLSQQSTIFEFYAGYFLFGAFGNALISAPLFANVGFWFRARPGLALGITASGGAFGQGIVPYFAGWLIEGWDWRTAYLVLAAVYLLLALPIAFFIRESPRRREARLGIGDQTHQFPLSGVEVVVWLSIAMIFCCNCMAVPIVHLVPLLTDDGYPVELATRVLMVLMMAGVAGRIVGGQLGDRIGALPAYFTMSLGQTVFVMWFPHVEGVVSLYLLAVCFGFTYSGVMSSILVCTRTMVSASFGGRAMSITSFFGWSGMGMGGYVAGVIFDGSGGYGWSYGFASIAGLINLVILAAFWRRIASSGSPEPILSGA